MGSINITDKAINKIQEVLKDQNMKYFRIRVKGGGCSGFQYVFKSENVINETKDHVFNFKDLLEIILNYYIYFFYVKTKKISSIIFKNL